MKIFVAGATGVIGAELIPMLVAAGHDVAGMSRSESDQDQLESAGARPISVDLFDPERLTTAVAGSDVVINLATSIPPLAKMGRRRAWRVNDRLRGEGAANLVDAAIDVGATRFIQPSVAFIYANGDSAWLSESAPIDRPVSVMESALEAEASTSRFTREGGVGVVLRLGRLYGPGRVSAELVEMLRSGRGIVVGDGSNYVPSLHIADAAAAHVAALDIPAGIYNVVDDNPVRSLELATAQAEAVGGTPPRRIPAWVGRLLMGDTVRVLTDSQRVSNSRFKAESGWRPTYPDAITGARTLT